MGELGASSAGVLFLTWGYLHAPEVQETAETAAELLSFAAPVSFAIALLGVDAWYEAVQEPLGKTGLILALIGTLWGALLGLLRRVMCNESRPTDRPGDAQVGRGSR